MYNKNEDHKQYDLFDAFWGLPPKMRERLEGSRADTFYRIGYLHPFRVEFFQESH